MEQSFGIRRAIDFFPVDNENTSSRTLIEVQPSPASPQWILEHTKSFNPTGALPRLENWLDNVKPESVQGVSIKPSSWSWSWSVTGTPQINDIVTIYRYLQVALVLRLLTGDRFSFVGCATCPLDVGEAYLWDSLLGQYWRDLWIENATEGKRLFNIC